MDKRTNYNIDDYLKDDNFILAIVGSDFDKIAELEEFMRLCPQQRRVIEMAKGILLDLPETSDLTSEESSSLKQSIFKVIEIF
ncbi:hypothetical protein [Bacteroides ihuae]|uniref:hypothetical protein n=1 Tax=Bacteroides ihuae TaxID=1852362 RepID=UPI0008D93A9D|nr:hypothetical protein [Bacteroides ihuae]